jgi:hypothetical protein
MNSYKKNYIAIARAEARLLLAEIGLLFLYEIGYFMAKFKSC